MTCKCDKKPTLRRRTMLVHNSLVVDAEGVAWWVDAPNRKLVQADFDYNLEKLVQADFDYSLMR